MNLRNSNPYKVIMISAAVWLVSGCELLKETEPTIIQTVSVQQTLCESAEDEVGFGEFCNIDHWIDYIIEAQAIEWADRYPQTKTLGDTPSELVQKILLSQGTDTPYQNRLRAQNWIVKVNGVAPPSINKLLKNVVYTNSKQLLEFESAITILSQVNARQEKTLAEVQLALIESEQQIQIQQDQIDQLLKIETDLLKNNRN